MNFENKFALVPELVLALGGRQREPSRRRELPFSGYAALSQVL